MAKNKIEQIYNFFTAFNEGQISNQYFDGDWFIYEGEDIKELKNRKPFVIKEILKTEEMVEIKIIPLKRGKKITDNYSEEEEIMIGFSTDTIVEVKVDIPNKNDQFHGYRLIEIIHDLGKEKITQEFFYEPAGE